MLGEWWLTPVSWEGGVNRRIFDAVENSDQRLQLGAASAAQRVCRYVVPPLDETRRCDVGAATLAKIIG
jgi:hypothetical protein